MYITQELMDIERAYKTTCEAYTDKRHNSICRIISDNNLKGWVMNINTEDVGLLVPSKHNEHYGIKFCTERKEIDYFPITEEKIVEIINNYEKLDD